MHIRRMQHGPSFVKLFSILSKRWINRFDDGTNFTRNDFYKNFYTNKSFCLQLFSNSVCGRIICNDKDDLLYRWKNLVAKNDIRKEKTSVREGKQVKTATYDINDLNAYELKIEVGESH